MGRSSRPASGTLVVDLGIDLPLSPFVKDFVENFEDKRYTGVRETTEDIDSVFAATRRAEMRKWHRESVA